MKQVVIVMTLSLSAFSFGMIRPRRTVNTTDPVPDPGKLVNDNCAPHARCMISVYGPFTKAIKQNSTLCYCARGTTCRRVEGDPLSYIYKCQRDRFAKMLDRHLARQVPHTEDKESNYICESHTACMCTVYEPFTRKIKYNFKHVCHCGPGTSCQRTDEDDLSIGAYIYKCKPNKPNK